MSSSTCIPNSSGGQFSRMVDVVLKNSSDLFSQSSGVCLSIRRGGHHTAFTAAVDSTSR